MDFNGAKIQLIIEISFAFNVFFCIFAARTVNRYHKDQRYEANDPMHNHPN